ncbi:MAG: hypothetical protein WC560_03765 [Syntrophales bacterium]
MIEAGCKNTAMGIMPHTDIEKALDLALSLDIPFWPQLPGVSFFEDMYAQASQNFPGIIVDTENKKLNFNTARFEQELGDYFEKMDDPATFVLSEDYSVVYHRFLTREMGDYHAIRGQVTGPVSFGFNVIDENRKPIIYNDEVRAVLFDFTQKKVNVQYRELREKNSNAFVWVDEPGLGYVFSGLSGYNDRQAKEDYAGFLQGLEGPKGMHLCANVNLPYLLELGIEILSFDAYQIEFMPREYTSAVAEFLRGGGIIAWGIIPTESTILAGETPETLAKRLIDYWEVVVRNTDLTREQISEQALVAPARCCLRDISLNGNEIAGQIQGKGHVPPVEERIVEKAFDFLRELSQILREKYG